MHWRVLPWTFRRMIHISWHIFSIQVYILCVKKTFKKCNINKAFLFNFLQLSSQIIKTKKTKISHKTSSTPIQMNSHFAAIHHIFLFVFYFIFALSAHIHTATINNIRGRGILCGMCRLYRRFTFIYPFVYHTHALSLYFFQCILLLFFHNIFFFVRSVLSILFA